MQLEVRHTIVLVLSDEAPHDRPRWPPSCRQRSAARSVDKLHIGDKGAQLLDQFAGEQRLAADDHQDVVFARREFAGDLFELLERGSSDRNNWLSESSVLIR